MPDFEVRPARPEDREAVLAFCQQTWEWGDYIEYVWDEWLNNPQGKLFVAIKGSRPVGVANMRMLNKTEAWFEGMRVDPTYRQHGIASALLMHNWPRQDIAELPPQGSLPNQPTLQPFVFWKGVL